MKFIKKLAILIVTLIALILIIALFVKNDFTVTRSVEVSLNKSEVFDYIRYLEHQEEFAVWQKIDPKTIYTNSGTDGTVGAINRWESKHDEVGIGEQEIVKIEENKRIDFELRFIEPMEMTANAYMLTEDSNGNTKVSWSFEGHSPYPWNFFLLFMDMEENLGPDLQKGLDNLKSILEAED